MGVSELVGENVAELNFEFIQNRFQLVEGNAVLAPFDTVQRGMGDPNLFGEICVREIAPSLS